jgi:hypothetical protein
MRIPGMTWRERNLRLVGLERDRILPGRRNHYERHEFLYRVVKLHAGGVIGTK